MSNITTYPPSTPMQWTAPYQGVIHPTVDARSAEQSAYRKARTRAQLAANPDQLVHGILLPYNVIIDDGIHGPEVFTLDTTWEGGPRIPFKINHSALLGVAEVYEDRVGLHIEGRIGHPSRRRAQGKWWLSAKLTSLESHRRRDGVVEHVRCRLDDASLTDRPVAKPYTYATFSDATA